MILKLPASRLPSFSSSSFAVTALFTSSPSVFASRCARRLVTSSFVKMPKADSPSGFSPLKDTALFTPFKLGPIALEHRIVQAPLTRMRSTKESDGVTVPNDLVAEYYGQRASKGGLQLAEATDIHKYASDHRSALRKVTRNATADRQRRQETTRVLRVSSQTPRSPAGKRLQTPSMQRAVTFSRSCGTLAVLRLPVSVLASRPSRQAPCP